MKKTILAALAATCLSAQAQAQTVGTLVPVGGDPGAIDMVHDFKRDVMYIATAGAILRYHVGSATFLTPWSIPGAYLMGIDISSDAGRLAAGDWNSFVNGLHLYNLETGSPIPVTVTDTEPFSTEDVVHSVAFDFDGAILFSSESLTTTGGSHPLRRYDPLGNFSRVGFAEDNAMLAASGNRRKIAIAGAEYSNEISLYDAATRQVSRVGGVGTSYEVAVNQGGTQVMAPDNRGRAGVWNVGQPGVQIIGDFGGDQPIAGAYHPVENLAYFPWGTTREVRVYNTATNPITQVGAYDFGYQFGITGGWAYTPGRTKISADGSLLMVKVEGGIRIHRLYNGLSAADTSAVVNGYAFKVFSLPGSIGNGGVLTYSLVRAPTRGTVDFNGPTATYRWRPPAAGPDSFRYRVSYGLAYQEAEVTLRVLPPPATDFNRDGNTDLVWSHGDGRSAMWLMNGLTPTVTAEINGPATGWSVIHSGNFDVDGYPDLVWQNTDGRAEVDWRSATNGAYPPTLVLAAGSGWTVTHVPDLDGDGRLELLLRHTDGRVAARAMNGYALGATADFLGAGTGWSVARVADFDGDGKHDLLWVHEDGRHAIWLMDGLTLKSGATILNAGSGWTAIQTPDLDGDGKADLLWRHTDGSLAVWLMNGAVMTSGTGILGPGSGWNVKHVGDFDGDGKADLYFEHPDGRAAIWLMNGLAPAMQTQILNAGGGWTAKRLGDFNGDGKADIVWENTDGRVAIWLMNGTAMTNSAEILPAGTGWSIWASGL
ncbi:hypothetical protein BWI17_14610 [Betaproteobacteria bacterium GR16-43]|nr:hypothetical protein BWI17_14610 [Betaproteobacteria bacterium GR16-43]